MRLVMHVAGANAVLCVSCVDAYNSISEMPALITRLRDNGQQNKNAKTEFCGVKDCVCVMKKAPQSIKTDKKSADQEKDILSKI